MGKATSPAAQRRPAPRDAGPTRRGAGAGVRAGAAGGAIGRDHGRSLVWIQGLLVGAVVALATPTALLLGVLLGPGLVALVLDGLPGKPVARAMLLFGLAPAMAPLRALWTSGHTLEMAMAQLADPRTLAFAWSAAACGWLAAELAPLVVRAALDAAAAARRRRLLAARRECAEEWGYPEPQETAE